MSLVSLTLEEIAREADASLSTMPRVVNNQPNVREEVRNRVVQVVEQAGYHPNIAARSLVSQPASVIGLVIPRSAQNL